MNANLVIKIVLSALLFGCLLKMPYGYYQFIRIAGCAGFIYLAYEEFKNNKSVAGILSAAVAILLNPIFKIHFNKTTWNIIDAAIGIALVVWIIIDLVSKRKETT